MDRQCSVKQVVFVTMEALGICRNHKSLGERIFVLRLSGTSVHIYVNYVDYDTFTGLEF